MISVLLVEEDEEKWFEYVVGQAEDELAEGLVVD